MDIEKLIEQITDEVMARVNGASCAPAQKTAPSGLARYIDHTLLKQDATKEQVIKLCEEAKQYQFASVCVNPSYVPLCASLLKGTPVKVCCVVGFPLGATTPEAKSKETAECLKNGAEEIDMVANVGAIKSGDWELVKRDIEEVVATCRGKALVKVIIEACLLTDEEKVKVCTVAKLAGADFVKTSTGFSTGGATVEDVRLMRRVVGPDMGVKASGGVRTLADATAMIEAGANRIGTSNGVQIVSGESPAAQCQNCGRCRARCPAGLVSITGTGY